MPQSSSAARYAVLFDWDGVVVDTSRQHKESWEILARENDMPLPHDHFTRGFGKLNRVIIPDILGWTDDPVEVTRLGDRKEEIYRELIACQGITPLLGVERLLARLLRIGVPSVICTSTPRANIDAALSILGIGSFFAGAVCSEDVATGKPNPEVFLKGAEIAGVPPEGCAVIEDSLHGLEGARKGGMKAVAIATTHPADLLLSHADLVITSHDELTNEAFRTLFSRQAPSSSIGTPLPKAPKKPQHEKR